MKFINANTTTNINTIEFGVIPRHCATTKQRPIFGFLHVFALMSISLDTYLEMVMVLMNDSLVLDVILSSPCFLVDTRKSKIIITVSKSDSSNLFCAIYRLVMIT